MEHLTNNVTDVALIFEGGGMRNSYSSGVVNVLLENEIYFDNVYGVSAGATNAVNYLSRDEWRSRVSFTDYVDDLSFRWFVEAFLRSDKGGGSEAHPHYAKDDKRIPFDFDTFHANPARLVLPALDRDTGETANFTNPDFQTFESLMACVRASTSYPIIMHPKKMSGRHYYDGGIGEGAGISLPQAKADGLDRYFVVCTRPRGYRRPLGLQHLYDAFFWRRPHMRHVMHTWTPRYNAQLKLLEQLEAEGRAYVFYANDVSVSNVERDVAKLKADFEKGYAQAQGELPAWREFLKV